MSGSSRRSASAVLLGGAAVVALVGVSTAVAARLFTDQHAASGMLAGTLSLAEKDQFYADAARVHALDPFPGGGTHDAGPLLNRWVSVGSDGAPDERPPWAPTDPLDRVAAGRCERKGDPWPACVAAAPAADLTWMAELPSYDTWDPASSGAYARWLAENPDAFVLAAPTPELGWLVAAARIRLLQGRDDGTLAPALRETHAVAELSWASEDLIGALLAVALLDDERRMVEEATTRGLDVGGFVPVAEEDVAALRRYTLALVKVYLDGAGDELAERVGRAPEELVGRCVALQEALRVASFLKPILADPWPGERDLRAWIAPLDAAVRDGAPSEAEPSRRSGERPCRLPHVGPAWRGETLAADASPALQPVTGLPLAGRPLLRVPWVRQAYGVALWRVLEPDYNLYD